MKKLFENLGIWEFENAVRDEDNSVNHIQALQLSLDLPEQIELIQFGRFLHDWRPKGKQKKNKQDKE